MRRLWNVDNLFGPPLLNDSLAATKSSNPTYIVKYIDWKIKCLAGYNLTSSRWRCEFDAVFTTRQRGKDHCATSPQFNLIEQANMLFLVCADTAESKSVKRETRHTVIIPKWRVFPDVMVCNFDIAYSD